MDRHELRAIGTSFDLRGDFETGAPYGAGHIHDTFLVAYRARGSVTRYLHQRINHAVFRDPALLMRNVGRVLAHLREKHAQRGSARAAGTVPTLVPAKDGSLLARDERGGWWRTWFFLEGSRSFSVVEGPGQAFSAARAFGGFQRDLLDLPGPRLEETIPGFHDTRARFLAFRNALAADQLGRASAVAAEVDFALAREGLAGALLALGEQGLLDERVVHNDTKLDNLLFDAATGEVLAVVDLDTVMPGLGLFDFGDLVRTVATRGREDDPRAARVEPALFEALARGYLDALAGVATPAEREALVLSGKVIAYECGLRFLADHLDGDRYFRTQRAEQNADRCRAQFALVRSLEESEDELRRIALPAT
jgi:hypothetical protein